MQHFKKARHEYTPGFFLSFISKSKIHIHPEFIYSRKNNRLDLSFHSGNNTFLITQVTPLPEIQRVKQASRL